MTWNLPKTTNVGRKDSLTSRSIRFPVFFLLSNYHQRLKVMFLFHTHPAHALVYSLPGIHHDILSEQADGSDTAEPLIAAATLDYGQGL